jgi:hypothetical protein
MERQAGQQGRGHGEDSEDEADHREAPSRARTSLRQRPFPTAARSGASPVRNGRYIRNGCFRARYPEGGSSTADIYMDDVEFDGVTMDFYG